MGVCCWPDPVAGRWAGGRSGRVPDDSEVVAPWQVERGEVTVWVGAELGMAHTCPECTAVSLVHDHVERRWRHVDTFGKATVSVKPQMPLWGLPFSIFPVSGRSSRCYSAFCARSGVGREGSGTSWWLRKRGRRQQSDVVDGPWCVRELHALAAPDSVSSIRARCAPLRRARWCLLRARAEVLCIVRHVVSPHRIEDPSDSACERDRRDPCAAPLCDGARPRVECERLRGLGPQDRPRRFDQRPSHPPVAGLGDEPELPFVVRTPLARHEAEVRASSRIRAAGRPPNTAVNRSCQPPLHTNYPASNLRCRARDSARARPIVTRQGVPPVHPCSDSRDRHWVRGTSCPNHRIV